MAACASRRAVLVNAERLVAAQEFVAAREVRAGDVIVLGNSMSQDREYMAMLVRVVEVRDHVGDEDICIVSRDFVSGIDMLDYKTGGELVVRVNL